MDTVNNQMPPTPSPTVSPMDKIKAKFMEVRGKVEAGVLPTYKNMPPATRKMVMGEGILLGVVFILLILALLFAPRKSTVIVEATPTPAGTSVPFPTNPAITNPSRYATDSGVLKIESDVKTIEGQLNQLDIKQSDLNLPDLDWNVNFNQ